MFKNGHGEHIKFLKMRHEYKDAKSKIASAPSPKYQQFTHIPKNTHTNFNNLRTFKPKIQVTVR